MTTKTKQQKIEELRKSIQQIQTQTQQVVETFAELVGDEPVDKPAEAVYNGKKKRGRPPKVKAPPVEAPADVSEESDETDDGHTTPIKQAAPAGDEPDVKKNYCRRLPFSRSGKEKNQWKDDRTDSLVDPDTGKSLLVSENPKAGVVVRKRPGAKARAAMMKVVCSLCEGEFEVSPSLAFGFHKDAPGTKQEDKQNTWKCNDCNSNKGRLRRLRESVV